jgi:hypothetical protein
MGLLLCDCAAPGSKEPSEATRLVLAEEFGGMDLSAEIAKLMAEEAVSGHSVFASRASAGTAAIDASSDLVSMGVLGKVDTDTLAPACTVDSSATGKTRRKNKKKKK